jgi:hypothetical protein
MAMYCVVYRCNTRLFVPAGNSAVLPATQTPDGPMQFMIKSEFVKVDEKHEFASHLVLQTTVPANNLREAQLATHGPATTIAAILAFAHNAYIEPPTRWFSFEVAKTQEWRPLGQIEFESPPPLITQRVRQMHPKISERIVAELGVGLSEADQKMLHRALIFYLRALRHWEMMNGVFAAHYLFIAAETLTPIALRQYLAKVGKAEDKLLKEYLDRRIPATPKGATPEDDAAIAKIIARMTGPAKRGAENEMKGEARRNTIFVESPDTHTALREATNGLEHGHQGIGELHQILLPHVDRAASCVRNWIIEQSIADPALRAQMVDGERKLPLVLGRFSLTVGAEFRCNDEFPTPSPSQSPFRISPKLGELKPEVVSLMKSGVELRSVSPNLVVPEDTFEKESVARADVLERWGFKTTHVV